MIYIIFIIENIRHLINKFKMLIFAVNVCVWSIFIRVKIDFIDVKLIFKCLLFLTKIDFVHNS